MQSNVHTRLDAAKAPEPLPATDKLLTEAERRELFEAHRGYINDLGVQIGRRHFDSSHLAYYFDRSALEPFARNAKCLEWGREASDIDWQIKQGYQGGELLRGFGGGGGSGGGEAVLALFAVVIAVELVGVVAYQGWKAAAKAQLAVLSKKSEPYKGSSVQLMHDYNQWLALSLGVSPTAAALNSIKVFPPPWPITAKLGVNAEKSDWADDYRLEKVGEQWYFGGRQVQKDDMMLFYGKAAKGSRCDLALKSLKRKDVDAFNESFRARLFQPLSSSPTAENR